MIHPVIPWCRRTIDQTSTTCRPTNLPYTHLPQFPKHHHAPLPQNTSPFTSLSFLLLPLPVLLSPGRYAPFTSVTIKPNPRNSPDPAVQREAEGEKVLKALDPRDYVVVLDERGQEVGTCGQCAEARTGQQGAGVVQMVRGAGPTGHRDCVVVLD